MASSNKVALIADVTGQDGAYLAELLLKKGCEVQPDGIFDPAARSHEQEGFDEPGYTAPLADRPGPRRGGRAAMDG